MNFGCINSTGTFSYSMKQIILKSTSTFTLRATIFNWMDNNEECTFPLSWEIGKQLRVDRNFYNVDNFSTSNIIHKIEKVWGLQWFWKLTFHRLTRFNFMQQTPMYLYNTHVLNDICVQCVECKNYWTTKSLNKIVKYYHAYLAI